MSTREEAIATRLAAATPGQWEHLFDANDVEHSVVVWTEAAAGEVSTAGNWITLEVYRTEDAKLIANAPADLAWLLEENARLRTRADETGELLASVLYQSTHSLSLDWDGDGWNEPLSEDWSCTCGHQHTHWSQFDRKCSDRPTLEKMVAAQLDHELSLYE